MRRYVMSVILAVGVLACGNTPPSKRGADAQGMDSDVADVGHDAGCLTCCPAGFEPDGATCVDVDECARGMSDCAAEATCTNEVGRFTCVCNAGFFGDGTICGRTVSCIEGPTICAANASCDMVDGGLFCVCGPGLIGDGATCAEVDGCAPAPCHQGVACTDVSAPGVGFTCGPCPAGMVGDGLTCADEDGCAAAPCAAGVTCNDVPAPGTGFSCGVCPPGTQGDGEICTEIDGCAGDPCYPGVACADVPAPGMGFTCDACPTGFAGDGEACADDCLGRVCGASPTISFDCGTCSGATDVCDPAGQCVDDCSGRVCGDSPVGAYDCGACSGNNEYCDAAGQCVNDCLGRQCGPSPVLGDDCGTCAGASTYCEGSGRCINDCAGVACGPSPVLGVDCGTCAGSGTCNAGQCQYEGCVGTLCWYTVERPAALFTSAQSHCNGSTRDGFTDWRLPMIDELKSLIVGCGTKTTCPVSTSCTEVGRCHTSGCLGCTPRMGSGVNGCYWSATLGDCVASGLYSSTSVEGGPNFKWVVEFASAGIGYVDGTYSSPYRCVRPR